MFAGIRAEKEILCAKFWYLTLFATKRACEAEPLKQEAIYRVSVNIDVFDGNKKAAEQRFAAVFKEVVAKNGLKLSGEYWMHPAFYGVAFF